MPWVDILDGVPWQDWDTFDPVSLPFLAAGGGEFAGVLINALPPAPAPAHAVTRIRFTATARTDDPVGTANFTAQIGTEDGLQTFVVQPVESGVTCTLTGEFALEEPIQPGNEQGLYFYILSEEPVQVTDITFDVTQLEIFVDVPVAELLSDVFVYTMNRVGQVGAWSRYAFPFPIDGFAQLGDDLYIRAGDSIVRVDPQAVTDQYGGVSIDFTGLVQWAWLDFGQPGVTKMLEGFDLVGSGTPSVSFGYDQRNLEAFTDAYVIDADTVPGQIIPYPLLAPSLSLKIDFAGGEAWSLQSTTLYLHDQKVTT